MLIFANAKTISFFDGRYDLNALMFTGPKRRLPINLEDPKIICSFNAITNANGDLRNQPYNLFELDGGRFGDLVNALISI